MVGARRESVPLGDDRLLVAQSIGKPLWHAANQRHARIGVLTADNLGVIGQIGQQPAISRSRFDLDVDVSVCQPRRDGIAQAIEPFARRRTDRDRFLESAPQHVDDRPIADHVHFVEYDQRIRCC